MEIEATCKKTHKKKALKSERTLLPNFTNIFESVTQVITALICTKVKNGHYDQRLGQLASQTGNVASVLTK